MRTPRLVNRIDLALDVADAAVLLEQASTRSLDSTARSFEQRARAKFRRAIRIYRAFIEENLLL